MTIDITLQKAKLKSIADAIRQRGGTDGPIPADDFPDRIRAIKTSGPDLSVPLTVTAKPGATVTAVNGDETLSAAAGEDGLAVLQLTKPGTWTVTATLDDWSKEGAAEVPDWYSKKIDVDARLPDYLDGQYTEVAYVESGSGQYINLPAWSGGKIILDVEPLQAPSGSQAFFGYGDYYSAKNQYGAMNWSSNGVRLLCKSAAGYTVDAGTTPRRMKLTVDIPNKIASVDGNSISFVNTPLTQAGYLLWLKKGSSANAPNLSPLPARVYGCQVYDAAGLIRDFVPCVDNSGVAGLYELVNDAFYKSLASAAFIAGPEI